MQGDRGSSGWRRGASSDLTTSGSSPTPSMYIDTVFASKDSSSGGGGGSGSGVSGSVSIKGTFSRPKLDGTYIYSSHTLVKRSNGKPFVLGEMLFKEDGTVMCVYNYKTVAPEEGRETALSPIGITVTSRWKLLGNHGIVGDSFTGSFSSEGNNLHLHLYDDRSGAKLNTVPYFYHYIPCAEVPYGTKQAEEGVILSNEDFEWNNKLALRFVADDADHNLDAEGWEEYLKKPEPSGGSGRGAEPDPSPRLDKSGDEEDRKGITATASNFFGRKSKDDKKSKKKKGSKDRSEQPISVSNPKMTTAPKMTQSPPPTPTAAALQPKKKQGTAISGTFYLAPRRRGSHQPKPVREAEVPNMQTTLFAINRDTAQAPPPEDELTRPIKGSYLLIKRGGDKASVQSGYWVINLTCSGEDGQKFAKFWPTNAEKYGGDPSANQKAARGIVFDSRILFMDKKGRTCVFNIDPLAVYK